MKSKNSAIRTLRYVRPYWHLIVISALCGIIKLCTPMVIPQVVRYFIDVVLSSDSLFTTAEKLHEIYKWLVILFCLFIFIAIPATYFREVCALKVSNNVMFKMRCELYDHIQKMSARFFNKNKSGALVSRISNDIHQVHEFIWTVVTNVWIDAVVLIILIVLMASINVPLTILSIIALPLSAITTKKVRRRIRNTSKKAQNELAELSGFAAERFSGYETVRLFNNSVGESNEFKRLSENYYKFRMKTNKLFSLGNACISFFSEIITSLVICLAAVFIVKGNMTTGDLIVFYTYLGSFTTPLRRFAELNVAYAQSIAGIERVYEILDTEPDIKDSETAVELDDNVPMNISFENVCFKYDNTSEKDTVSDISFDIKEGEKIALVGSSGCGKTTVVNLLARFYDVDKGSIKIAGKDIREYKLASLYNQIGMVFQNTILFSDTIENNIKYGTPSASKDALKNAAVSANALEFINATPNGFKTLLGEKGTGLSGGQKQRIAIARIFLKNPRILILDEATSALDSESEELVQQALDKLMKGRTSVVIAHRLSTIVNADKILVMDKGRIVEYGKHKELLNMNGRYKELFNKQFKDILTD